MMAAPIIMPIAVPRGPAVSRNKLPGMTKAPQPMMLPKAKAQTLIGLRLLSSFVCFLKIITPCFLRALSVGLPLASAEALETRLLEKRV